MPKTSLEIQLSPKMFDPQKQQTNRQLPAKSADYSAQDWFYKIKVDTDDGVTGLFGNTTMENFKQIEGFKTQLARYAYPGLTGQDEKLDNNMSEKDMIISIRNHLQKYDSQIQNILLLLYIAPQAAQTNDSLFFIINGNLSQVFTKICSSTFLLVKLIEGKFELQTSTDNKLLTLIYKGKINGCDENGKEQNIGNYDFQLQITQDKNNQVKIAITKVSVQLQSEDPEAITAIKKIRDEFRKLDGANVLEKPDGGEMIYVDPPLEPQSQDGDVSGMHLVGSTLMPVYDSKLAAKMSTDTLCALSPESIVKLFQRKQKTITALEAVGALDKISDSYAQQKSTQQNQLNEINKALLRKIPLLKKLVPQNNDADTNPRSFGKLLLERIKLPFTINRTQSKLNKIIKKRHSFVSDNKNYLSAQDFYDLIQNDTRGYDTLPLITYKKLAQQVIGADNESSLANVAKIVNFISTNFQKNTIDKDAKHRLQKALVRIINPIPHPAGVDYSKKLSSENKISSFQMVWARIKGEKATTEMIEKVVQPRNVAPTSMLTGQPVSSSDLADDNKKTTQLTS